MAYTPELSYVQSCTLRRIAWALDIPMTKAMYAVFDYIGKIVDSSLVCERCRDRSHYKDCIFKIS